ncbi:MAG TPA: CHAT domain-containing protein [Rudaea sp.]|nr:CHAT domain-containing protein [Rudaea sp.]
MGNHALCLYQLGELESALGELHAAYAFANDHGDHLGRAKIAEYLAGVYIAYGDSDTANAFAAEAEALYRRNNLVANLAPALRLRARIEADRNNLDAALERISEAWSLATGTHQMQAVANIAGVYANILLDRGDLVEAGNFIHAASRTLGKKYEAHDRLSLRAAELRWLRLSGRRQEARDLASKLLGEASYPGSLRTAVLIERFLLESGTGGFDLHRSYKTLLTEIRHNVAMVPDPDLAFRILHIVRPAAEAAISSTLDQCPKAADCAKAALMLALEYFSLEPRTAAQPLAPEPTELRGLLQSLSSLQARDDFSAAPRQLVARIKELQAAARMRAVVPQDGDCESCAHIAEGAQLVYLFGDARSWRWQRAGETWDVRELPPWPKVARSLRALADPQARGDALADLSIVVADLQNSDSVDLRVGGDARTSQIPWAALHYRPDEDVVDRYAVSVEVGQGRSLPASLPVAGFLASEGTGGAMLGATASEREIVRDWSARFHLTLKGDESLPAEPMTLLHISAHGQRDIGNGTSILWLKDRPLLSYVSSGQPVAETVVINACDSAAASEFGLTQSTIAAGFLRAGTRTVVATLFPVSDNAALAFTEAFYRNYVPTTRNAASAVRAAQIALRRRRFSPYAWAAYVVVSGRPQ